MSEWTIEALKEYFAKQIEDLRNENNQRFVAQEKAVETAFNAAKEAVVKSEIGVEKRSDAVYVTITKLQDALSSVMPRAESEQRYTVLTEKIAEITNRTNTTEGKSSGSDKSWATVVTIIGIALGAIGLLYGIFK